MSLDGGISENREEPTADALEADYCQNAAARFHAQWSQTGTFAPAALRYYGMRGETTLLRSLKQARSFQSTFGTCLLGSYADVAAAMQRQRHVDPQADEAPPHAAAESTVPLGALLLGRAASVFAQSQPPERAQLAQELAFSKEMLEQSGEWCQSMCGMVSVEGWAHPAERAAIEQQLNLAAFLGLRAVLLPLPPAADPDVFAAAITALRAFLKSAGATTKVWLRCDACTPSDRDLFHRLNAAVLLRDADPDKAPSAAEVPSAMHRDCLGGLFPYLYFSHFQLESPAAVVPPRHASAGGPSQYVESAAAATRIAAEWLGEDVVAFEVPCIELLEPCLAAAGAAAATSATSGSFLQSPAMSSAAASFGSFARTHGGTSGDPLNNTGSGDDGEPDAARLYGAGAADADAQNAAAVAPKRPIFRTPPDMLSKCEALWGGQCRSTLHIVSFLVELLRRRAAPVFVNNFFDHYAFLNYHYFHHVVDASRESFFAFEDVLQLPLQPLGHQLASLTYEVFERDARKYSEYSKALAAYVQDWLAAGPERQHRHLNEEFLRGVPMHLQQPQPCLYLVLLGCGRGPLLDECLLAASLSGVTLRIFAIEKNAPAAAFTRLKWSCDPEIQHQCATSRHSLEVVVADGRELLAADARGALPADFGLCDVVVSELLGSFGDNELSPECLEVFHAQLLALQAARGIAPNPALTCIPQSYTAWLAPLHSARAERVTAEGSIKGLTSPPPHCPDGHAALFHSLFVCNLSRGLLAAPPQPAWTFEHFSTAPAVHEAPDVYTELRPFLERHATLRFALNPRLRCSALVGFFSAVLYTPKNEVAAAGAEALKSSGPVEIGTAPACRTANLYSWFPCVFALEPRATIPAAAAAAATTPGGAAGAPNGDSKSAAVREHTIVVDMRRELEVNGPERRVWYSWEVSKDDGEREEEAVPRMNTAGWASSFLL